MEKAKVNQIAGAVLFLTVVGAMFFALGLAYSIKGHAAEKKAPKTVYPKNTELDFEGSSIEGELRNPGEFYFQHRNEERPDSLIKRRLNFHREMLRDVVTQK